MNSFEKTFGSSWAAWAFLALAAFWGTSFVAIEVGLHYFPPLLFAGLRYVVAGAIILTYAISATNRWRPRGRHEWLAVVVTGALVIGAYHGLLYLGELYVGGSIAATVISLTPVMTAAFAGVILPDERLDAVEALGFLLGLAGVVIIANPNPDNLGSANLIGALLVLLSGASFAFGAVLTRPLKTDLPLVTLEAWAMLVGSGLLLVVGLGRGESLAAIQWTLPAIGSLAYLTVVSGVVGFLLYFELLNHIGPTQLNLISYLEPVVATGMSWLLLGQLVAESTLIGFAAIFLGFAFVKRDTLYTVAVRAAPVGGRI